MKIQILLFQLLLIFGTGVLACGTPENWMDAYEGVKSNNQWRDSMNRLETLVMLSGCGTSSPSRLDKPQQLRLSRILVQSLERKGRLMALPSTNYEIRDKLKHVRSSLTFNALIETIYRRFSCLSDIPEAPLLHQQFGNQFCPSGESLFMRINAPNGGIIRAAPGGRKVVSFKNGTEVRVLGQRGEWYRISLPVNTYAPNEPSVAYVHESILAD